MNGQVRIGCDGRYDLLPKTLYIKDYFCKAKSAKRCIAEPAVEHASECGNAELITEPGNIAELVAASGTVKNADPTTEPAAEPGNAEPTAEPAAEPAA